MINQGVLQELYNNRITVIWGCIFYNELSHVFRYFSDYAYKKECMIMGFFAFGQVVSFMAQKSYQNHQLTMIKTVGSKLVTVAIIGAASYLGGKYMDKEKS